MVAGEPLRRVGAPTPRLLRSPPLAKVQSHSHHLKQKTLKTDRNTHTTPVGRPTILLPVAMEDSSLLEESSIDSRGQDMQHGGQSCAEQREQGSGRRRRRRRTRQRRATRQRKKRQGRARREGGDREVARRSQRESERDCEER